MYAWKGGAQDQLQGQFTSAKISLARMISPQLYWVMTGDDFTLDINNPDDPKVLVVGNNPDRQNYYSAALGLYNSRIVKLINKKKIKNHCCPIKVFQRKKSRLFHRTAEFPACQISDYSTEPIKCLL